MSDIRISEACQATPHRTATDATALPPLSFEARLAAVDAAMTIRLETALLTLDIDSAHTEQPVDLVDVVRVPGAIPTATESEYATPIAALLQRAQRRLEAGGWCTGMAVDEAGARCMVGAIRAEAQRRGMDASATAVVLDAIRRQFADVETVPQFNDAQTGAAVPIRILGEAANLAAARGI
ncbi:DUF6197 family protein [Streptomyces sp. 900116325]